MTIYWNLIQIIAKTYKDKCFTAAYILSPSYFSHTGAFSGNFRFSSGFCKIMRSKTKKPKMFDFFSPAKIITAWRTTKTFFSLLLQNRSKLQNSATKYILKKKNWLPQKCDYVTFDKLTKPMSFCCQLVMKLW